MGEVNFVVCIAFDHRSDAEGLRRFKECICHCDLVDVALEVSGTYDLIVEGKIASLEEYTTRMDHIRPQIAEFASKIEENFVSRKILAHLEAETFLWVPCVGGRKRIDIGLIDKVVAEGDYMRLFTQGWHCLIHSTIRALKEHLDARFIQLHRSSIVRIDFIDRLMHHDRRWIAHLRDGSQQAVAKSHLSAVLNLMARDPSKDGRQPAKSNDVVEQSPQSAENQMQMTH